MQWLLSHGYDASPGSMLALPGGDGTLAGAVLGIGDPLDPFAYAHAPYALPRRRLATLRRHRRRRRAMRSSSAGAWAAYRFTRYRDAPRAPARLALEALDDETSDILAACVRVRDLVNTPTQDMGPEQLEQVVRELAQAHGAQFESIVGDELLQRNFPAIHAVGRASHRAPRLIALRWGGPKRAGRIRMSPSSARACASTPAASTSSSPTACAT